MEHQRPKSSRIEVAAGLVFHKGKLLITQRPATGHLANLWEFPGGKREINETFEHCLHRELKEELDIEVTDLELLDEITHAYPEKTVHLQFIRCRLAGGTPKLLGCQDFRWISREELSDFQFPDADGQLLEVLQRKTGLWTAG